MHRLTLGPLGRVGLVAALLALAGGCAHHKLVVHDTPYVEQLRIRITKVRHAISETRRTIAGSQGAPYLPELYVRLAELLSEEAKYHYQVAYEREQRSSKVLHVPQVRLLKEEAISTYHMVLRRYPKTSLAPRILLDVGQEERELGEFDKMQSTLEEMVAKYPTSPLANEALLTLGDYHFDKNQLDDAAKWYGQIIGGGPSRISGLAFYKQAWVKVNQGDCKNALSDFEKAIIASKGWAEHVASEGKRHRKDTTITGRSIDVRREALVDLTYCYSREKKPEHAVAYLHHLAANRVDYVAALEKLATRYGIMDQAIGAIAVGRELLTLGPDGTDRLDDARMLYSALKRLKSYHEVGQDVTLIATTARRESELPGTTDQRRASLVKEFEAYTRDLATRAQTVALRKKSARFAAKVAMADRAYLDAFPHTRHRADMLENLGDMLKMAGDPLDAGRRYLAAATVLKERAQQPLPPPKKAAKKQAKAKADTKKQETANRKDDLYDSVVQLQKALAKVSPNHVDRVVARAALRRAGTELLGLGLGKDKARRVKFAIAQTYYDEGRYREAIERLNAVAYEYPGSQESDAAINLILDSYNTIDDYEGLINAGRRYLAGGSPAGDTLKAKIKPIVLAAEQRRLDELSLSAAGEEGGGVKQLEKFAQRYAGTDLGQRALLNAFVAARASGDSTDLYKLGDQIAQKYPKSDQLPGILSTLARTAAARFEFDRAIQFFHKAAQANPAERVTLLVAAGQLQEQLADDNDARKAYQSAITQAQGPAKSAPEADLAELLEREGRPADIVSHLQPYADDGSPDVLARLGLAQLRQGNTDAAEATFDQVMKSGAGTSTGAQARANYGLAEVYNAALEKYQLGSSVESIQEFIGLLQVTEESYLKAARQGSPLITAAALGRLAYMAKTSADRFANMKMPPGLTADQAKQVRGALQQRIDKLRSESKDALEACANQAWTGHEFNPAVRACLAGKLPSHDPVAFDQLKPRHAAGADIKGLGDLRNQLSRNPDDLDSLRKLGTAFLDAGDAHAARLVFAHAASSGGGPTDQDLLGVASWQAGDYEGALDAFAQAADGGLEAGRKNLAYGLQQLGLGQAATTALKKFKPGGAGGRLLSGAGSMAAPATPQKQNAQERPPQKAGAKKGGNA